MYAKRPIRKRSTKPRRRYAKKKAIMRRRIPRSITTNTAAVKETYSFQVADGIVTYFRAVSLADVVYDRSQAVASAFQQYRVKYVKLTFRPSADTYPAVPGNVIPQLYFMVDKANSIPTNADANTFFSMGARPYRMDDKNLKFSWLPTALVANMSNPGVNTATQLRSRPWLSTNANANNPAPGWAPDQTDHLGAVFYVTKINPADTLTYFVDVEVVFQFRKPVWKGGSSETVTQQVINGQVVPITNNNSPPIQT